MCNFEVFEFLYGFLACFKKPCRSVFSKSLLSYNCIECTDGYQVRLVGWKLLKIKAKIVTTRQILPESIVKEGVS